MLLHLLKGFLCCFACVLCGVIVCATADDSRTGNARDQPASEDAIRKQVEENRQRFQKDFPLLSSLHGESAGPYALKPITIPVDKDPDWTLRAERYNTAILLADLRLEELENPATSSRMSGALLVALERVNESRISLAETKDEKLKMIEQEVALYREVEKYFQMQIRAYRAFVAPGTDDDSEPLSPGVLEARYARQTAEIKLSNAKK